MLEQSRLPEHIDPRQLARKGQTLRGRLPISGMPRLVQALAESSGEIEVELAFDLEAGRYMVRGRLRTEVSLICQRCMEHMRLVIEAPVTLEVVGSDEAAAQVAEGYEPYTVAEDEIALGDMVEDELLLALPIVPMHEDMSCQPLLRGEAGDESKRPNPFAVLGQLKKPN